MKKITITLLDLQLVEIRKRVPAKDTPSISGFIQQAVQKLLENAAEFRDMIEEGFRQSGPVKPNERAWARRMPATGKHGRKRRKAA